MKQRRATLSLVAVLLLSFACRGRLEGSAKDEGGTDLAGRESRLEQARAAPDTGAWGTPLARWVLPQRLAEISGLALTPDGRLFAAPDERAIVSEIDYRRGIVVKQFLLGRRGVQGDFEGMAIAGEVMYLLTSNGKVYEFREGANEARVEYSIHDLELGKECEFEGLAYDESINSLLLACKHVGIKELKDHLVIYRWLLTEGASDRLSRIATPVSDLMHQQKWKDFRPTGIEVDPFTGNYVITTAERALVIASPEGAILETRMLPETHDQPEGVALTRDSMIIISDEAVTRPAVITLYRWP
jgi:uncharacterized protein YjiK